MGKEINLKQLFDVIRNRFWIVIVFSILFAALGGFYSIYFTNPLYESTSSMIVDTDEKQMNTFIVMIKEPRFLDNVVKEMKLNKTAEELSQQITAGSIGGTSIVQISVKDKDNILAAKIANTIPNVFKREMKKTFGNQDISNLYEAKVSQSPININQGNKMIVLSFIIGIIAGVGMIFLLDFMDNTIRTESSAEQLLEIPVLGSVSKINKKNTIQNKLSMGARRNFFEANE